eukprot:CAMPEP_0201510314 /NCGR_PEP_ID=MMETSP0161_2-20130828/3055_1 /ASSEMBLY_ACC=CAM_ASM_000251 /TAXON_ID=180227 /ORGANISM="Neoparamoeba aestuarina, Strain SoJaBio B1-5/56/2" /LENGTH=426 /DNA_ID=CAMNT_0047905467 /DNA_START=250 /DNA_END=1530 /DNA_ORIENTATION=-
MKEHIPVESEAMFLLVPLLESAEEIVGLVNKGQVAQETQMSIHFLFWPKQPQFGRDCELIRCGECVLKSISLIKEQKGEKKKEEFTIINQQGRHVSYYIFTTTLILVTYATTTKTRETQRRVSIPLSSSTLKLEEVNDSELHELSLSFPLVDLSTSSASLLGPQMTMKEKWIVSLPSLLIKGHLMRVLCEAMFNFNRKYKETEKSRSFLGFGKGLQSLTRARTEQALVSAPGGPGGWNSSTTHGRKKMRYCDTFVRSLVNEQPLTEREVEYLHCFESIHPKTAQSGTTVFAVLTDGKTSRAPGESWTVGGGKEGKGKEGKGKKGKEQATKFVKSKLEVVEVPLGDEEKIMNFVRKHFAKKEKIEGGGGGTEGEGKGGEGIEKEGSSGALPMFTQSFGIRPSLSTSGPILGLKHKSFSKEKNDVKKE